VIRPELSIEPLPTFYQLTADACRFLRPVLIEGWGKYALSRRQFRESGPITRTVGEGIDEVIAICDAAADLSRLELEGCTHGRQVETLRSHLAKLRSDEDVTRDARGVVPLQVDDETGEVRILAFVGWELRDLRVALTHARDVRAGWELGFESHRIPVPLVRETWVDARALSNRVARRALCDSLIGDTPGFGEREAHPGPRLKAHGGVPDV
jgi:hypothetical protein